MIRVLWSEPAVDQLAQIRQASLRLRVYQAVGGLVRFPRRGRAPPEVVTHPDLQLPADLREIVFPRILRVFYRYDERNGTVHVLGIAFRGQDVGADWLVQLKGLTENR
ncbi:MAG: type II toxin-antitoxin system RelE/ParE family toxin [Myxococcota bacterium]